jgi:hypothetical protein|tara:strand:- start:1119 stop:1265 length:147 start_codon:yes stop_codon:yes gene_type:complete
MENDITAREIEILDRAPLKISTAIASSSGCVLGMGSKVCKQERIALFV